jgi:hypothetical protein
MIYTPNNWVVLRITEPAGSKTIDDVVYYKVLAGWSGGYLDGDSWRMNSAVTSVEVDGDYFLFHGVSGSCYKCRNKRYGLKINNAYIYNKLKKEYGDRVHLMDEDTDWTRVEWN